MNNKKPKYNMKVIVFLLVLISGTTLISNVLNFLPEVQKDFDVQKVISAVDDKSVGYLIYTESLRYDLDPYEMAAIAYKESNLKRFAHCKRPRGGYDRGFFQVYSGTAEWLFEDVLKEYGNAELVRNNPKVMYESYLNIHAACGYMRWILDHPKTTGAKRTPFSGYGYYNSGKKNFEPNMDDAVQFHEIHFGEGE